MNSTTLFDVFKQVALLVFTPQCFDTYFLDADFLNVSCFKSTLSKGLGLGIIAGSLAVKLPQLLKIYRGRSGEGINLYSVTLDLTAITIYMSYGFVKKFPFSSYGDTMFLAVQTVAIAVLVLYYDGAVARSLSYLVSYLIICYVTMFLVPVSYLWTLQTFNIPIVVAGKVIQAWSNYKAGSMGQLSSVTVFLLFAGSAARIFTSIQETGDAVVIWTYIMSTLANGILVVQMIYYWDDKKKKE